FHERLGKRFRWEALREDDPVERERLPGERECADTPGVAGPDRDDAVFDQPKGVARRLVGRERLPIRALDQCELPRVDEERGLSSHERDRKSTRLNSSHVSISYAVFCLKKKI